MKPKRIKLKLKPIDSFTGKYRFLSNFSEHPVLDYPTNEHFFQAQKTKNKYLKQAIKELDSPGKAKQFGRKIELRPEWEEPEFRICKMLKGLELKFSDPALAQMLVKTGDRKLIEGNYWHDNFWGNCTCSDCTNIKGNNYLGKLLMRLRKELK